MRTRLVVAVVAVGLLVAAVPAWAHHAFAAEFDQNKPIKVQGAVVKWELTNPHSWIHIDVKGADGKTVTWMIDRKSTRLNSSHSQISYAVFCLKKKKNKKRVI